MTLPLTLDLSFNNLPVQGPGTGGKRGVTLPLTLDLSFNNLPVQGPGTGGKRGVTLRPSTQVSNTSLDNWGHETPTQSKRIKDRKEKRIKG